jgi:5-oxoprolinase (ATP-hydrolysing)
MRLLVNRDIPMNEGLLDHVDIIIPNRGLLNPDFSVKHPPAVVGGNTEVSQRLTDTLLKALGMAACSQGTMNNFLFGNERFGYYETICGGTGAVRGFDGTNAVHQHMTNTRISDPELLEWRFPVRLLRFEVRKNSGGKGKWRGGDGVVREFLFMEDLDINILSQHRVEAPYGLNGGGNGKVGKQYIVRGNKKLALGGSTGASVHKGDQLVIETPGGGGYGKS